MDALLYYRRLIAIAVKQSFGTADAVAGAIGIFGPPILRFMFHPGWDGAFATLAWQIPLGVFLVWFTYRLVAAPYWLHEQGLRARQQIEQERDQALGELDRAGGQQQEYDTLAVTLKEANDLYSRDIKKQSTVVLSEWLCECDSWYERAFARIEKALGPSKASRFAVASSARKLVEDQQRHKNDKHLDWLVRLYGHIENLKAMMDQPADHR